MAADRVSVPPDTTTAPLPPITPPKVLAALVTLRVRLPRTTLPAPATSRMLAPLVVAEMSKVPLAVTRLDVAMPPLPDSASVVPASMMVSPA